MTPAFVACCSKAGLAVIRGLGEQGVPIVGLCYGVGQSGAVSRFVHEAAWTPDPTVDEEGFIAEVLRLGHKFARPVLIPTDDGSLVAVSKHVDVLSERFRVVSQPWTLVHKLIEKHFTYEIARIHGIPCPRLVMARTRAECLEFTQEIGYPCLLKPSISHLFFKRYRKKMLMLQSEEDLRAHLDLIDAYGGEMMLCEYIPGGDECGANYNSFAIDGRALHEFTAHKVRNKPRLIGFPTVVRSAVIPEIRELGRKMLAALKLSDFSCIEFKYDPRDGHYKLMEVNARHNYSGALALACGMNFPLLSYDRALGRPLSPQPTEFTENVFWIDEERDARGLVRALIGGAGDARRYLEPYRCRKVFAVYRSDDLRPSLSMTRSSVTSLLTRGTRTSRAMRDQPTHSSKRKSSVAESRF